MREYEIVYIFDSAVDESAINEKLDRFNGLLAGDGAGEVTATDHWGRRPLSYAIDDHDNGYYVVLHVTTAPERLPEFERIVQLDESVLRYLVVINEGNLPTSPAPPAEERDEDEDGEGED